MKVDITYPRQSGRGLQLNQIRNWIRWPFLFAAYICPILNLCAGGKAWSVIVLWSLWMAWSLVFSPDLVEYNRISQIVKLVADASALLIMIDLLLAPGWADEAVPLVCFSGIVVTGTLFFTDLDRQKQNMMPMLWMILISIISVIISFSFWTRENGWPLALMGAVAAALLFACYFVLGRDLLRELKKRFHTK